MLHASTFAYTVSLAKWRNGMRTYLRMLALQHEPNKHMLYNPDSTMFEQQLDVFFPIL